MPSADIKETKKKELPVKETDKNKDTAKQKEDMLANLSNMKETNSNSSDIKQNKNNKAADTKKETPSHKPLSTAKKLAAAALLGTTLGLAAISAPDIKDKIDDYMMSIRQCSKKIL